MADTTANTLTQVNTPEDFPNKDLVYKFVKRILNYSQEDTEKISAAAVYDHRRFAVWVLVLSSSFQT